MSETKCYVAIMPCGCAVGAVTQGCPDAGKEVAKWIRRGMAIETKPVSWVRENLTACECPEATDD